MNRRTFIKTLCALPVAYLLPAPLVKEASFGTFAGGKFFQINDIIETPGNLWVRPEVIAKEALDILNKELERHDD